MRIRIITEREESLKYGMKEIKKNIFLLFLFSYSSLYFILLLIFGCTRQLAGYGILVPDQVSNSSPPALGAHSLNYWTAREVPNRVLNL